jgi:hypothetical protein
MAPRTRHPRLLGARSPRITRSTIANPATGAQQACAREINQISRQWTKALEAII